MLTRAVASVLRPDARFVVTDLSEPMLGRAAARQGDPARVEWRPADAMDLPMGEGSFDLVLCQFAAMFFPERVQAYREARRVLSEGGTFLYTMWDRIETNEFAHEVSVALGLLFPDDPPRFLLRTPHGHHDPDRYRVELEAAGFTKVEVEVLEATSAAADPSIPAIAYCQGTPLRNEIEARGHPSLEEATSVVTESIRRRFGDKDIQGRIRGFVISAS